MAAIPGKGTKLLINGKQYNLADGSALFEEGSSVTGSPLPNFPHQIEINFTGQWDPPPMTEERWLAGSGPGEMLWFLTNGSVPVRPGCPVGSDRKLRLFAAACYWDVAREADALGIPGSRAAQDAEEWAETGQPPATHPGVRSLAAENFARAMDHAHSAAQWAWYHRGIRTLKELGAQQAEFLRDIIGNPFRERDAEIMYRVPLWYATGEQRKRIWDLAQTAYDKRDWKVLPILADALEEAGCVNEELLGHLRGSGPHCRGCWAVDLILGKK